MGGHTIDDPEPKYGLAVTGVIKPGDNPPTRQPPAGDLLILTKPLGTGIIATAIKRGMRLLEARSRPPRRPWRTLNRDAAEVAREHGVRAVTDVTGFGLLGHLIGDVSGRPRWRRPVVRTDCLCCRESRTWLGQGVVPGGTKRNLEHVLPFTEFESDIEDWWRLIAADAQTSGGLLLAVAKERAAEVVIALKEKGVLAAAVIGMIREEGGPTLRVSRSAGSSG